MSPSGFCTQAHRCAHLDTPVCIPHVHTQPGFCAGAKMHTLKYPVREHKADSWIGKIEESTETE